MFAHVLTLALSLMPANVAEQSVEATTQTEKLTQLNVDGVSLTARVVKFESINGSQTCTLEGNAKVSFGDILISADKILSRGGSELESLVCTGNCRWQQNDDSREMFVADKLELRKGGLRLTGNASFQHGDGDQAIEISCDSISIRNGTKHYDLSGAVQLRRR